VYAFFWVIPQRLNCICRRFGTLCLFLWRWDSVPKRRHIKFRRRGINHKKVYKIENTAKVWNQEIKLIWCFCNEYLLQRFYWTLTINQLVSKYPGLRNRTFPHRANELSPPNPILNYYHSLRILTSFVRCYVTC